MNERRQHGRFDLLLRTTIEVPEASKKNLSYVLSSNISAGGAYFHTTDPLPEGKRVKLKINVTSERLQNLTGAYMLINVGGAVVRSTSTGMAICFAGDYEMVTLRVSMS
ncbi:MAG: PilZ domain-containing protein [Planctomycetota bacterium]|jgi:hypothetical protein